MTRNVATFVIAAIIVGAALSAPVGAVYDDGQFSLNIPDSWYTVTSAQIYERYFIASPQPILADQIVQGEDVESQALLTVVIGLIPVWLQQNTLPEAAVMLQQSYETYAADNGQAFEVVAPAQYIDHYGHPALEFTLRTGPTTRRMLLAVRDDYIFRLETTFEEPHREPFESIMAHIAESFRINGAPDVPLLQPRATNVAVLPLPPGWHLKHHESHQSFVSREKVEHPDDVFYTGVTLFAIPDYAATYRVPPSRPDIMYQAWLGAILQALEQNDPPGIALDVWLAPVDGIESLFIESASDDANGLPIQTLQVATVKDDHFFVGIFEAPVAEFFEHRPMFMQSIQQLQWVVPSR